MLWQDVKVYRPTAHQSCWKMLEPCVQVLKIDRHKYVKIAYHGFKAMSREDRLNTYSNSDVCLAMHVQGHPLFLQGRICPWPWLLFVHLYSANSHFT